MAQKKKKFLIAAQIPPPYLGQAIMTQVFMDTVQDLDMTVKHIPVNFSKNDQDFGKFKLSKFINVLKVNILVLYEFFNGGIDYFYYQPSGHWGRSVFWKDFSLLFMARILAKKRIFHLHSDGFSRIKTILSPLEQKIARFLYKHDISIYIVDVQKSDILEYNSTGVSLALPNGIPDHLSDFIHLRNKNTIPILLYVGLLVDYKGIENALNTVQILKTSGYKFKWVFIGGWSSPDFERTMNNLVRSMQIEEYISFPGPKNDNLKWEYYAQADIFCLPTRRDLMPLCLLEAMMMQLPIVTTNIRTIPYILQPGINALISSVGEDESFSKSISMLLNDPPLRNKMALANRSLYEKVYSQEIFRQKILMFFNSFEKF